jgi:broad specificity phosphatase PhoE
MRLILVRHGETEANAREINEGHSPGKLTAKGKRQAKLVGMRLRDEKIDKIYVSDLKRTVDTASEIIRHHPKARVVYEPLLRERNQGVLEKSPYGTFSRIVKERGENVLDFKPEGGESINEVKHRIGRFLDRIMKRDKDKTILLVTHGGVIVNMLIKLLRIPEEGDNYKSLLPQNTAVTIIAVDSKGKKNTLETFNCVKHLM